MAAKSKWNARINERLDFILTGCQTASCSPWRRSLHFRLRFTFWHAAKWKRSKQTNCCTSPQISVYRIIIGQEQREGARAGHYIWAQVCLGECCLWQFLHVPPVFSFTALLCTWMDIVSLGARHVWWLPTCRLLRERKAEDHLFGDKDKFVTAAYKKKLEEDKKWLEEEAIREKKEAEEDVTKRGHMGDFYRCKSQTCKSASYW